jgi:hypothetical protein
MSAIQLLSIAVLAQALANVAIAVGLRHLHVRIRRLEARRPRSPSALYRWDDPATGHTWEWNGAMWLVADRKKS